MAVATAPLIPADGTLQFADGAALTLTIAYEDGDFQTTNMTKGQKTVQAFKDRGSTYAVREVEDTEVEFSFTCHAVALLGDGSTAMPTDAILRLGVWAAATSTLPQANGGGTNGTYTLKLTWTGERSNFGATSDTTIVLKYCKVFVDFAEGVPGKLSVKGTCYCISTDYLTVTG